MQSLSPVLITPPTAKLMTLDEAKAHIKRDDDDDNSVISSLIDVVTTHLDGVDGILGRALVNQTWAESHSAFPAGGAICLRLAPLVSVTSISYFDRDNAAQTLAGSAYSAHNTTRTPYVKLGANASWPSTAERDDAVTITYQAGYGADAEKVPATIRHAAKLLLGHFYENREAAFFGTIGAVTPIGVMNLLRPFIRPKF